MLQDRIDDIITPPEAQKEEAERRIRDAWQSILSHRSGRRVVFDLLGVCHFGLSAFAGETNATMFIAGKQKVGEHIMDMLNLVSPEAYQLMIKEAKEDSENDRASNTTGQ